MSLQHSDKVSIALDDVSAYFSEEEWKPLQEWQKELYRNVMKEIHQALISLGPLIASTLFSIKAKEQEAHYSVDSLESNRNHVDSELPDCYPVLHPEIVLSVQEPEVQICRAWSLAEETETINHPTKEFPIPRDDMCWRKEGEDCTVDPPYVEATEYSSHSSTAGPDVISFIIKEEDDTCVLGQPGINSAGRKNSSTGINKSLNSNEQQRAKNWERTTIYTKDGRTISHKSDDITNQRIHLGGKAYAYNRFSNTFNQKSNFRRHQGTLKGQRPSNWTQFGRSLNESSKVSKTQDVHTGLKLSVCSQCGICFIPFQNMNPDQQTNSVGQQNTCSDCVKKANLNKDQGKRMADRRHMCTECGKRFKTSQLLVRHWRIHTGEKPYKCETCGKSFRQTPHLIRHQLMHTRENKLKS